MGNQWRGGEFNPSAGLAAGTTEPVTRWPSPQEQEQSLTWTTRIARPTPGSCEDYLLADRQEQWDTAEAQRLTHEAYVAERKAERESVAAQAEAERDAAFAAREAKRAEQLEAATKARYLAAGNTADDWERDREAVLRNEAMKRLDGYQGGALISREQMLR